MANTPKRGYLIPDPSGSIFPQVRDMILDVDDDVDTLVSGPLSSVNDHIATFDGTTGKIIKDSGYSISDIMDLLMIQLDPMSAPGFIGYWEADGLTAGSLSSWPSLGGGPTMSGGVSPEVVAGVLNGKSVVRFAATKYLTFSEITNIRTVYIVMKHDKGTETNRSRFMPFLGHSTATHWIGQEGSRLIGSASSNVTGGNAYLNGYPMAVSTLSKSGEFEIFAFVTIGNTSANQFANDRGSHWLAADVAAILMYSQPHTPAIVGAVSRNFMSASKRNLIIPPIVVHEGDSLSADRPSSGSGISSVPAGNAWPNQMISMLNSGAFGNYDTYNVSVGGQTVAQMISDYATEVAPLFNPNRSRNVLTFMGGINDMGVGGGEQSAATTYNRIVTYCQMAQDTGFEVVVSTITPRKDLANFANQAALDAFEVKRDTVNDNIATNWATFSAALVDLRAADFFNNSTGAAGADSTPDLEEPNNTLFFNADKIHHTALGMTTIATAFKNAIAAL